MKDKVSKNVRFYYGIIFGVYTVAVGAIFIGFLLSAYYTGAAEGFPAQHPFTRDRVISVLSKIDLFFWLWVAFALAGIIMLFVLPVKEKKQKIAPELQYARLLKRMPSSAPDGLVAEYEKVAQYNRLMLALKCASYALLGAAAGFCIVYLAIPGNFTRHANVEVATSEVIKMVTWVFPCVFAAFLVMSGVGIYETCVIKDRLSALRKLTMAKARTAKNSASQLKQLESGKSYGNFAGIFAKADGALENKWVVLGIRAGLAVIAVTLIIVGALNGNMIGIFNKAVAICSQCIGLA